VRDSIADLEKLLITVQQEAIREQSFLSGLLDHKNATIGWFRDRQRENIEALEAIYESMLVRQREDIGAMVKIYDDMIDTLTNEVSILEKHISTVTKGTTS